MKLGVILKGMIRFARNTQIFTRLSGIRLEGEVARLWFGQKAFGKIFVIDPCPHDTQAA